jgi:hypothetical protein
MPEQAPAPTNDYLRGKLEKTVAAILNGTPLEGAINILKEEQPSVSAASPLLQEIFNELKEHKSKESLRTACRSILNEISVKQGGYEFESMFNDTKVIFESKKQQNAFLSVRNNLTSIEVNKNNRLTGLVTDLTFNEEFFGYLAILFPNLKEKLQNLEKGIIQVGIENDEITMKYKGGPSD